MSTFELDIGEQARVSLDFLDQVINEFQRAVSLERETRKVTQQSIAEKIGTSRAVVNRQVQGLENLSARRIAELFWAIGWQPRFSAHKIPRGDNNFVGGQSSNVQLYKSIDTSSSASNAASTRQAAPSAAVTIAGSTSALVLRN
jgi:hypothetical protein